MKKEPQGPQAARLRQHKFQLLHRFPIPSDLLPGNLTRSFTRCGNPRCHCARSEEHTSELQSLAYLVCRLLLEKKKKFFLIFFLNKSIIKPINTFARTHIQ